MTCWPSVYGGGSTTNFWRARRGAVPTTSVTVDGFEVTGSFSGLRAVAVAVLVTTPASTSAWVRVWAPVHTTEEPSPGAGSRVVIGQATVPSVASCTSEGRQRLEPAIGHQELVGHHAARDQRVGQGVRPVELLHQIELMERGDRRHHDVAQQMHVVRPPGRARPAELVRRWQVRGRRENEDGLQARCHRGSPSPR